MSKGKLKEKIIVLAKKKCIYAIQESEIFNCKIQNSFK